MAKTKATEKKVASAEKAAPKESKKKGDDNIFAMLAAKTKGEVVSNLKSAKYFVDTGSLALNFCSSGKFIDGGIPGGRITEIYGPSASGKTYFATNCLFGVQKIDGYAIYLDVENAVNPEWMAKSSHVDVSRMIRHTPPCLEDVFLKIYNVIKYIRNFEEEKGMKRKPILFVYDSISASPCRRELQEVDLPENYTAAQFKAIVKRNEQPGERAKVCSKELRKLTPMLEKYDATVVIINQVRSKIGISYGNPEVTGGGGNALPFYASLRFRTQQAKKITHKKKGIEVGTNVNIKNVKNRAFAPFRVASNVKLMFDSGVNPLTGLLSCFVQDDRIVEGSKRGTWNVAKQYLPDGVDEYKFSANKDENEVKLEVILDCPKLIDAKSREEVEDYLRPYGDFLSIFANADLAEENPSDDAIEEDRISEFYDSVEGEEDSSD